MLERLRVSDFSPEYISNKVSQGEGQVEQLTLRIKECQEQLDSIDRGDMDSIFEEEMRESRAVSRSESEKRKQSLEESVRVAESKRIHLQGRMSQESKDRRNEKELSRQSARAYSYYSKVSDELPEFITKQLRCMPNNKGFLWRDVYFFGEQEDDGSEVVLIEEILKKPHRNLIHEWGRNHTRRVYEKPKYESSKTVTSKGERRSKGERGDKGEQRERGERRGGKGDRGGKGAPLLVAGKGSPSLVAGKAGCDRRERRERGSKGGKGSRVSKGSGGGKGSRGSRGDKS